MTHAIEGLRAEAAQREREAEFSGPRDRVELLRLARRDRRLAAQLQAEQEVRDAERERALARLVEREGIDARDAPEMSESWQMSAILKALAAPEGQPCNDCGEVVIWRDDDWRHAVTPTSCFLARSDER